VRARRLVVVGATLTLLGTAVAGTAPIVGTAAAERIHAQQAGGGIAVVVGWAVLALGIHLLGRESGAGARRDREP
jgi:hypothetical protein